MVKTIQQCNASTREGTGDKKHRAASGCYSDSTKHPENQHNTLVENFLLHIRVQQDEI